MEALTKQAKKVNHNFIHRGWQLVRKISKSTDSNWPAIAIPV